jgi:dolichol-phosphate mannosyltransferase
MNVQISIIIPFLNEADNIPMLVSSLDHFFKQQRNLSAEVLFIDDGSTDASVEMLGQFVPAYFSAKVIKLSKNYGSHAALRAGILHAKGKYITFMYADLQDPLELIIRLYKECEAGAEIAWATRESTQAGFLEKSFSKNYAYLMKKFAISSYPENGFDIVMFGRKVQQVLNHHPESNSSIFLQILTLGFRQSFIRYAKQARKAGKSKWTVAKKIKLFVDSFIAFSFAPIRMVTIVGLTMFMLGVLWTAYIIGRKILLNDLESGWPALVSILMIGFGITNISLGIIAEYLWRTLDASRERPVYIIDQIIELPVIQYTSNELSK